jgi:hypothetical protein
LDSDDNRHTIDERFCKEVLDLAESFYVKAGPLKQLQKELAAEPSVRGAK